MEEGRRGGGTAGGFLGVGLFGGGLLAAFGGG